MSTTTIINTSMNLLTMTAVYMSNCLIQLGFRIETGRGLSGYMTYNQAVIERGLRTWLGEGTLLSLHMELFDPATVDDAHEVFTFPINYLTEPQEEAVKPPLEQLEVFLKKLPQLPPGSRFRVVATKKPGYTPVDGWFPTKLRKIGEVAEKVEIGDEFGYGLATGKITYTRGKWNEQGRV